MRLRDFIMHWRPRPARPGRYVEHQSVDELVHAGPEPPPETRMADFKKARMGEPVVIDPDQDHELGAAMKDAATGHEVADAEREVRMAEDACLNVHPDWIYVIPIPFALAAELAVGAKLFRDLGATPPMDWLLSATLTAVLLYLLTKLRSLRGIYYYLCLLALTLLIGAITFGRSGEFEAAEGESWTDRAFLYLILAAGVVGPAALVDLFIQKFQEAHPPYKRLRTVRRRLRNIADRQQKGQRFVEQRFREHSAHCALGEQLASQARLIWPNRFVD
ncbi:MAG TPA: hypothetical protein PKL08_12580 [Thermoanaerobaculaceae bacterium]|nr:hypothetical protein [Thermoanaerobaculaceae bacterium]